MRSSIRYLLFTLAVALFPILFGCAGSVSPTGQKVAPGSSQVVISIAEDSVTLGASESYQFTATVTGNSNTAVTWSLSGCNDSACGTLSPSGLYTAPSLISNEATAKVTAVSKVDNTKSDSVVVHHMPVFVSIAPVGAWVSPGRATTFTAAVRYDNNNSGVSWTLPPTCTVNTCGSLSNVAAQSVDYTAPATTPNPPTITLTATSITDPSKTADVTVTVSVGRALNEGDYAFSFDGWKIDYTLSNQFYTTARVAIAGHFHADSNGNIADGVEDVNLPASVTRSIPFKGTYSIGPDGRGSFNITTAQGTSNYDVTVDSTATKGRFIKVDYLPSNGPIFGSGVFELQDKSAFSLSSLAGSYAVSLSGTVDGPNRVAALGTFNLGPGGTLNSGRLDMTQQVHVGVDAQSNSTGTLSGSFGAPSATTGRGIAVLTTTPPTIGSSLNFAYYVVSSDKILMVQTDSAISTVPRLGGEVRRQHGPFSSSSFNSAAIFGMVGANRKEYAPPIVYVLAGRIVPDGLGSLTGTLDDNRGASNKGFSGSYNVDSNGRTVMTFDLNPDPRRDIIAYLYAPNEGFLMETVGTDVWIGNVSPQVSRPFTAASLTDTFLTSTIAPPSEYTEIGTGVTTFDGIGSMTSTLDTSSWTDFEHSQFKGTYSVAANGRCTLTFASPASAEPLVFWIISPRELLGINSLHPNAASSDAPIIAADLLKFEK
jgi:hypothetical protein